MESDPRQPDPEADRQSLCDELDARRSAWLSATPTADGGSSDVAEAFVGWLLPAARLAALGDQAALQCWPALASHLQIDVSAALARAAAAGIQRLQSRDGIALAEEIGLAEDAWCLAVMEPRVTNLLGSTRAGRQLGAWADAASHVPLDEDGILVIKDRRRRWPLPNEVRLPVVEIPLAESDLLLGASPTLPPRRLVAPFAHVEEAALFDDGRPTPGMIRRFATRRGTGATRSGRWLRADAELDPYWQVTLGLQAPGVGVRAVRIGPMAMDLHPGASSSQNDDETPRFWSTSLKSLPLDVRTRVVCGEISIVTDEGDRFLL